MILVLSKLIRIETCFKLKFELEEKKMANLKSFYYPGEVVEIKEPREMDSGQTVLNIIVKRTVEVIEDFKDEIEKTAVFFGRKADEAKKLKVGDMVVLSRCRRNPRTFVTEKGSVIDTVDIIAENFQSVPKAKFAAISEAFEKKGVIPTPDELEFTDEDAAALAALAAKGESGNAEGKTSGKAPL
jgi:hypothetical protein